MPYERVELPLDELGLDPRPGTRQVRDINPDWVRHLMDESDLRDTLSQDDPLKVRPWPEDDPRAPGCEQARYQVISGYHRTSAARAMGLATIWCELHPEVQDDAAFLEMALRGNTRHGLAMDTSDLRAGVKRLAALGRSRGEIAKALGMPKSTVTSWLSGSDTNASKKTYAAAATGMSMGGVASTNQAVGGRSLESASTSQASDGSPLTSREVTRVGVALARVAATHLPGLRVSAVRAWASTLSHDERTREGETALALANWLMAFTNELINPCTTPDALAEARRATGKAQVDLLNELLGSDWMLGVADLMGMGEPETPMASAAPVPPGGA